MSLFQIIVMVCHGISGPGLGLMLRLVVIIGTLTLSSSIGCGFEQSFSHQNQFHQLLDGMNSKETRNDTLMDRHFSYQITTFNFNYSYQADFQND